MNAAERRFWIVLAACGAIVPACLAVDVLFLPSRVLTDFHGHQPISPLYAFWIPKLSLRILFPLVVGAGYVVWVWYTYQSDSHTVSGRLRRVAAHDVWLAVFAVAVAAIRLPLADLGGSMHVYPGEDFWDDVPKVDGPRAFLGNFVHLQERQNLSMHGMSHPPGHTLFLWAVSQAFGRTTQAAALSMLAVGVTCLFPIYLLTDRVFGRHIARRVLVLFPVVPSIVLYAVSATDFLFLAVASWSLWAAIEAVLCRHPVVAIAAGFLAGLAAMFSFAEGFIGFVVGLFALAVWIDREGTAVPQQLGWMAAGLLGCYLAVRWELNYDWLESLSHTHRFHRAVIAAEIGRYTPVYWLYTSLGNSLAFAWYLGLPVVAGASLTVWETFRAGLWSGGHDRFLTRAVAAVLALMVFGGLFLLEVERIWLYMVGPLVAVACLALPEFDSLPAERRCMVALVAIMCLQCIVYESLLFTIW